MAVAEKPDPMFLSLLLTCGNGAVRAMGRGQWGRRNGKLN